MKEMFFRMPVQIGAPAHSLSDPTGLLSDCHRRIEMFLGVLRSITPLLIESPDVETKSALETALRYFRNAAPKHNADEEESLFPRLRRAAGPRAQAVLERLDALEEEHRWAAPLHEEVDQLGRKFLSAGALCPGDIDRFRSAVEKLVAMYREHIALEDEVVFPCAADLLSPEDKAAIAEEMGRRRNL
jgi:hemerythrin-like domain-containing protein